MQEQEKLKVIKEWLLQGGSWKSDWNRAQKNWKGPFGNILLCVVVTRVYTVVKTHRTESLMAVPFTAC